MAGTNRVLLKAILCMIPIIGVVFNSDAAQTEPSTNAQESETRKTCKIGTYLVSLHDLDMATGSFKAILWLWSQCRSKDIDPLEVMDFVNANSVSRSLANEPYECSGIYCSYVKISGEFRHGFDVRNYPFDRHDLKIIIENTDAPASSFSYSADKEDSKISRDIQIEGWRITGFDIHEQTYVYDTTFGDPAFEGQKQSDYSRIVISLSVARAKLLSFFKLVTGLYVSVALSMLAFLLGPYNGRRRVNVLVGTLFAVLVNHRVSEAVIGRTESVTLVDQLHFTGMLYIFAIALASIRSQSLNDQNRQEEAVSFDKRGLWIASISYAVINLIIIAVAAIRG